MRNEGLLKSIRDISNSYFGKAPLDYNSGDYSDLLFFEDVEREDFLRLSADAESAFGCKEVFRNTIENNEFFFYLIGRELICIGYFGCDKTVRIVLDSDTKLPEFKEKQIVKTSKTTIWQYEINHSLIDCGMCYIIRTATGSFFVIDSAHGYSVMDCDRIYKFLRERTPKGQKVHIAGWFITHGHDDHVAQFINYLKFCMDDSVIDKAYVNFIPGDHKDGTDWMEITKLYPVYTINALKEHPDIDIVRLHTGQTFYVDNLKIDVLCSHEDVFPRDNSNFNDSSVVIMISAEGNKILIPGDAGHEESYILEARYPDYLKADIVQQAHHGHFGTTKEFYRLVDADLVFFPVTQIIFDQEYKVYEENKYAIDLAGGTYYIASNGTVEVDLPYVKGTEKLYPDESFEDFKGINDLWGYKYDKEYKEKLYKAYLYRGGKPIDEYKNGF